MAIATVQVETGGSIDQAVVVVVEEKGSRYLRGLEGKINVIGHEVKVKKGKSRMTSRFLV